MPHFTSYDGAQLAYRVRDADTADTAGSGAHRTSGKPPLVCLAGGPAREAAYLGDLGGLGAYRTLVIPDARGTGDSPPADDLGAYVFTRHAEDLEALRAHLGLDRFALLAHDAAAATAQAYAARYADRLSHLVLLNPGSRLQGQLPDDARQIFESRAADEDWWEDAYVAVQLLTHATDLAEIRGLLLRAAPMAYGRWELPQQEHAADEGEQLNPVPRAAFWQGVGEDERLALLGRLRTVRTPVLVVTGDLDAITGMKSGEVVAACFPHARLRPLHGVGHYPWIDEPEMLRPLVEDFLSE
ncbi:MULTISPECIES: alpha/beta hydrolase [unclassified Streptomyces]|uniref:alpha/beta fold hydrolase n=1 Tax=unclassified Streptomyces TaxID=2593676 RepID=UPI002DD932B7|nr:MULTISPECIES: alpha/beta hydrolase [unclassified Streptomyces]WSA94454.1 alpha/beta hydrolase [Streptomyces sp. NBC_01795]WSB78873.1 alpha/beta hydrolase [Streptomyces sp. NBC_01775]WSS41709.1 alpha/beta hydrolase [Streptomyces sp. NBC_01187]